MATLITANAGDDFKLIIEHIFRNSDIPTFMNYGEYTALAYIINKLDGDLPNVITMRYQKPQADYQELQQVLIPYGYVYQPYMSSIMTIPRKIAHVYYNEITKSTLLVAHTIKSVNMLKALHMIQIANTVLQGEELQDALRLLGKLVSEVSYADDPYFVHIKEYQTTLRKQRAITMSKEILTKVLDVKEDYTINIKTLQETIQNRLRTLQEQQDQLKRLEVLQFAVEHGLNPTSDNIAGLIDYLLEKDAIMNLGYNFAYPNILHITLKSYITFSSDVDSLLSAIRSGRYNIEHKQLDNSVQIVKDIADYKLLFPIDATFRLDFNKTEDGNYYSDMVRGVSDITSGNYSSSNVHYLLTDKDYPHILRNAHVSNYNCFGGYKSTIRGCFRDSDVEGAVHQLLAATGSINPYDGTVFSHMRDIIFDPPLDMKVQYHTGTQIIDTTIGGYYEILQSQRTTDRATDQGSTEQTDQDSTAVSDDFDF